MRIPLTHTLALLAALAAGSPALGQVTINLPDYDLTAPTKEIAESKGKELNWSADRFAELFAVRPPKGNVILQDNPNAGGMPPQAPGGNWTLPWFAGAMPGMPAGMAGAGGMKAMTHEAAHLQLVHLVNDDCDDALKQSFNGYGNYLPDWIDESVAVYHEPDGQKKERRQQLKAILSKHIPFPKYFTMDHPIGGKGAAGLPPGMQPPPGGGVGGGVLKPGQMKGMEGANDYYVQSLSVIEYFCDRSGKPFFRFCVSEMQKGRSMDEVLEAWHGKKKLLKKLAKASKKA
ncbi:MAG: hypothetical protein ACYS22_18530, partial [Planctomycetota bacterium]